MDDNTSIMNAFDFTAIEEMDPSLGKHNNAHPSYSRGI